MVGEFTKVIGASVVTSVTNMVWLIWFVTVLRRKKLYPIYLFLYPSSSIMFHIPHHVNMAMLLRVVNEGERVVVNQVAEEVDLSVEVGSKTCETSQEPDFSVNEGKPRMHITLPCILQIDFAFAFQYCIK